MPVSQPLLTPTIFHEVGEVGGTVARNREKTPYTSLKLGKRLRLSAEGENTDLAREKPLFSQDIF
jgi:hypothetical protein